MAQRQKYMVIFSLILVAWAVGIAGLILWQTGRKHSPDETEASYVPTSSNASSDDHSQFGKLLK